MSYRKDQGRYARLVAFAGLVLLVVYGCFHGGGFVTTLDGWLGEHNKIYAEQFPLVGSLKTSTVIALALTLFTALVLHQILNRPRVADALIETEEEMHKVTWPGWPETWSGTTAVIAMVLVLFVFLTLVDVVLLEVMGRLWGGGS